MFSKLFEISKQKKFSLNLLNKNEIESEFAQMIENSDNLASLKSAETEALHNNKIWHIYAPYSCLSLFCATSLYTIIYNINKLNSIILAIMFSILLGSIYLFLEYHKIYKTNKTFIKELANYSVEELKKGIPQKIDVYSNEQIGNDYSIQLIKEDKASSKISELFNTTIPTNFPLKKQFMVELILHESGLPSLLSKYIKGKEYDYKKLIEKKCSKTDTGSNSNEILMYTSRRNFEKGLNDNLLTAQQLRNILKYLDELLKLNEPVISKIIKSYKSSINLRIHELTVRKKMNF